ncbi:ATP-dependent DNA helicase [Cylindrobasidium torrendii FP15055 ss-10]|uniref:ATP-dependent DNA helicase n=1 Tax=Cylindrobasidium torrendii FP15055 ss-10 TaxID=1314674 RepID=A0A0D7BQA0_9AGAR|nr:ATP-dependent DNA helicase [Cylindrobasidium torrendii FP15055 ss-10]
MRNLRSVFNLQSFRCNQLEAITATLEGRDVFVLMPTGGGKSLCYQLPAVCKGGKTKGVTVVVSPLLALMKDQVDALKNRGVDVCLWNSDTPQEESTQIQNRLVSNNRPMLLYVTPEKLKSSESTRRLLRRVYGEQGLARFVIDEAHCISTWGKDFREAYRCLDTLRDDYPGIPIIALTATANQNMVDDIIQRLKLKDCAFFTQSFNRPNLNYIVLPKKGKMIDEMVTYINREHPRQGGIVYCRSRAKCEDVAKGLREKGILAQHYHAGMASQDKEETQRMWQQDSCHVIVATVAFGMGIDKPDVRFVIHHDLPTTFDGYYQQTGRAGRDGNPSDCVLYYSYADFGQNVKLFEKSQQEKPYEISRETLRNQVEEARLIMQYASNEVTCRRVLVLQFFGEKFDPALCKRMCNNCASHELLVEENLTNEARAAVELVRTLADQNLTTDHCRTIFRGREIGKKGPFGHYPFFGAGKGMSVDLVEQMFGKLLVDDVFEEKSLKNVSGWHAMYLKVDSFLGYSKSSY